MIEDSRSIGLLPFYSRWPERCGISVRNSRTQSLAPFRRFAPRGELLCWWSFAQAAIYSVRVTTANPQRGLRPLPRAAWLSTTDRSPRALLETWEITFALHQYQPALQAFFEARRLAKSSGDRSAIAAFDTNIASLYTEMGDLDSAAKWIEGARERLSMQPTAAITCRSFSSSSLPFAPGSNPCPRPCGCSGKGLTWRTAPEI